MYILIACQNYPEADTNAGGLRLFGVIKILSEQGHNVSVLGREVTHPRYQTQLEALGVECVCDASQGLSENPERLHEMLRQHTFDLAILVQYQFYNHYAPYLHATLPACHLVLDTVDIHHLRLQRQADLYPAIQLEADFVRQQELNAIRDADSVWVVTETEQELLSALVPEKPLSVCIVPTLHLPLDSIPGYSERSGVIFIGGYKHSPNVDAVHYFMQDVMPILSRMMPGVRVTLAGSHPPDDFDQYCRHYENVSVTGFVEDHRLLLAFHRVGIAPLRYGAGIKGKIGEYMACGLPCVTTGIGAEGMRLHPGHDILVADDAALFAESIVRLYNDDVAWQNVSAAGLSHINQHFTPAAVTPPLTDFLDSVERSLLQRNPSQSRVAEPPKVSVIIPNFNHAKLLNRRLQSVLRQTYQDMEIVCLDDASTDESREVLTHYASDPRVRTLLNGTNSGSPFKQWNRGVQEARGKYFWIAESDDYADPRLLERLVEKLDAHPEVGLAYCQSWAVDDREGLIANCRDWTNSLDPERWKTDYVNNGRDECRRFLLFNNYIFNASAVLVRRTVYEQAGGADEVYKLCGDWLLWVNILLRSDIAYVAESLNYFRRNPLSVTGANLSNGVNAEESYRVYSHILRHLEVPRDTQEAVCKIRIEMWLRSLWPKPIPGTWGRHRRILQAARSVDSRVFGRLLIVIAWRSLRSAKHHLRIRRRTKQA